MLSAEVRASILSSYTNGKRMGDMYPTVSPQAINKRPISWVRRVAYGLGAQDFHFDKKTGLSIAFPNFNPIQLEDFSTALGYEMGLLTLTFNRDVFRKPTGKQIEDAKAGFKYSVAVQIAKELGHTLKEKQIPDPETRPFYYFKEALSSSRSPLEMFTTILTDYSFESDEAVAEALAACRKIFRIRIEAGQSIKGVPEFPELKDDRANEIPKEVTARIAAEIDSLIWKARAHINTGKMVFA